MSGRDAEPLDDGLEDMPDRATQKRLYSRNQPKDRAVHLLIAYKWPIAGISGLLLIISTALLWRFGVPTIPAPVWGIMQYGGLGMLISALPAYLVVNRWRKVRGVELLELDPVNGNHRHIRVGPELWSDVQVRSPWGYLSERDGSMGIDDLSRCQINGRTGFEVMNFEIREGRPVVVSTWLGEASGAEFRSYKGSYQHAHERLAERADKATTIRANQGEIVREAAEEVIFRMISTAEESGVPHGDEIDSVVSDVLDDAGMGDPLGDDRYSPDDLDLGGDGDRDRADQLRDEPTNSEREQIVFGGGGPAEAATDGGSEQ